MKIHLDCDAYQGEAYLKADWLSDFEGPTIALNDPLLFSKKAGNIYKATMPADTRFELHVPYSRSFLLLPALNDVIIKKPGGYFRMTAYRLEIELNKWFNNRTRLAWHCKTIAPTVLEVDNAEYVIYIPRVELPF